MMTEAGDAGGGARRVWFRPRVVLLLAGLLVLIGASVIVTDVLSPRQRQAASTTSTSPGSPR
jgi:hypothetical protein